MRFVVLGGVLLAVLMAACSSDITSSEGVVETVRAAEEIVCSADGAIIDDDFVVNDSTGEFRQITETNCTARITNSGYIVVGTVQQHYLEIQWGVKFFQTDWEPMEHCSEEETWEAYTTHAGAGGASPGDSTYWSGWNDTEFGYYSGDCVVVAT
ncbi:hypothetical protein [Gaopeijia maritima]